MKQGWTDGHVPHGDTYAGNSKSKGEKGQVLQQCIKLNHLYYHLPMPNNKGMEQRPSPG